MRNDRTDHLKNMRSVFGRLGDYLGVGEMLALVLYQHCRGLQMISILGTTDPVSVCGNTARDLQSIITSTRLLTVRSLGRR